MLGCDIPTNSYHNAIQWLLTVRHNIPHKVHITIHSCRVVLSYNVPNYLKQETADQGIISTADLDVTFTTGLDITVTSKRFVGLIRLYQAFQGLVTHRKFFIHTYYFIDIILLVSLIKTKSCTCLHSKQAPCFSPIPCIVYH